MLILNLILISVICVETITVMVMWHLKTGGGWKDWGAGRSLMGLLAVIFGITFLAVIAWAMPGMEIRRAVFSLGYVALIAAIFSIGRNILTAQRTRKREASDDRVH